MFRSPSISKATLHLQLQHSRRIAAQNHLSLGAGQVDLLEELYRPVVAHIEAIIAAEHNAFRAHLLYKEFHHRL